MFLILTLFHTLFFTQSINFINPIKVLSSDSLKGRGYTFDGHKKAAHYLINELKNIGTKNLSFQFFEISSNQYTEEPLFSIDSKNIELSKDYIPLYSSGSGDFNNIKYIDLGFAIIEKLSKDVHRQHVLLEDIIPESIIHDGKINNLYYRILNLQNKGVKSVLICTEDFTYGTNYPKFNIPIVKIRHEIHKNLLNNKVKLNIKNITKETKTQNVLGEIQSHKSDSTIIIMAHYDHLGALSSKIYFPGANDNASGVSLVLNLAKVLVNKDLNYSILIIFFSGEEVGLLGSKHFIKSEKMRDLKIKFILNFDMVGSGENGIMILGGEKYHEDYNIFKNIGLTNNLPKLSKRRNAAISDHFFFLEKGIKGFYIYTLAGKQPYHSINDIASTIQVDRIQNVFTLIIEYMNYKKIWENSNE